MKVKRYLPRLFRTELSSPDTCNPVQEEREARGYNVNSEVECPPEGECQIECTILQVLGIRIKNEVVVCERISLGAAATAASLDFQPDKDIVQSEEFFDHKMV